MLIWSWYLVAPGVLAGCAMGVSPSDGSQLHSVSPPPFRPNRSFQHIQELADPSFFFLLRIALPPEEPGVQFLDEEGVLEALHHPVDDRNDHFNIQIFAQLAALE